MSQTSNEQQLQKVMRVSRVMAVLLQIGQAFAGIGMAFTLIAMAFASSFQLNLGNGDLGITFFQQEQSAVVLNLYDARDRIGPNFDSDIPAIAQAARLEMQPTLTLRVVTASLLLIQVSVFFLVLEHLAKLFSQYAKGEIFTVAAVSRIRKVGYTLLGLPAIALLNSIFAVILSARIADSGFDASHLSFPLGGLFLAVVVILISWIMDVGRALREENELTI